MSFSRLSLFKWKVGVDFVFLFWLFFLGGWFLEVILRVLIFFFGKVFVLGGGVGVEGKFCENKVNGWLGLG